MGFTAYTRISAPVTCAQMALRFDQHTFRVQGNKGNIVPNTLASYLATVGNWITGLRAALPIFIVAVIVPWDLHHDGVLSTSGNSTEKKNEEFT